ncbi:unnamed protein product (macronuclear) [Paramecium tetraurelia]|uniref:Uncharacterized protein n=1 Tax=Paramecium tetraurelia TaxID=5888 RepID=A0CJE3_PARTE|nr:uncharacterized protein GSPATT00000621001 [Paramecium tetraurelia]CAK70910.1 unnamed protein product [Paramecium tetraurelia]|eukprot:XP_001438307.1 hypothetical protein (macronuclear) [Paramecium tetraurelia strain d4-2]
MIDRSPKFKIEYMAPLSQHQKVLIEEEPNIDIIECDQTKISFNEKLIVCNYKPWQTVIEITKTIEKLKGHSNVYWINPTLDSRLKSNFKSILKNSPKVQSNLF